MAESKVILTKTIANLGHSGDVVSVRAGYARNYLIPQGFAFPWTKNAAAQIEEMRRARLAKAVATREDAVAAKAKIEGTVVEITARVSESGKLFGAVNAEKVADALAKTVEVAAKDIKVENIKTPGEFPATIALHPEISANITVKVIAE
ncbi:MAG: 50S ribosomal protein L9 [Bifidobacteriaceae bacterium]|nr:50S ribosomal protein L9 [Bifidobacteriaceae bacterium]